MSSRTGPGATVIVTYIDGDSLLALAHTTTDCSTRTSLLFASEFAYSVVKLPIVP